MGRRGNLVFFNWGTFLANVGGAGLYLQPVSEVLGLQALPAGQQRGMRSTLVHSQAFLLLGRLALQCKQQAVRGVGIGCEVHTRR